MRKILALAATLLLAPSALAQQSIQGQQVSIGGTPLPTVLATKTTTAQAAAAAPVQSVAGRTGAVTLTHADLTDWSATLGVYQLTSGLGSAAFQSSSAFDTAGAAASALTSAEAYSANAANITSGTIAVARLPVATSSALGVVKPDGTSITISGGVISAVTGGSGTVTSVALTAPSIFGVTGSPVTGSGSLGLTLANETANQVWAGPSSGSPAAPGFRSLVAADIPSLAYDASGAAAAVQSASLQKASNLSDLASASTARTNLGLGSAATQALSAFDAAGAAATAQSNAETFSANASNLTSGTVGAARGGAGTVSGLLKANGSGVVSAAVSGTDYAPATTGTQLLAGNGAGGHTNITLGSGLSLSGGVLSASGGGSSVLPVPQWRAGQYYPPVHAAGLSYSGVGPNALIAYPIYVPNAIAITSLSIQVSGAGSAGSLAIVGLYADASAYPGALIAQIQSELPETSANIETGVFASNPTVGPGIVWVAFNNNSGSASQTIMYSDPYIAGLIGAAAATDAFSLSYNTSIYVNLTYSATLPSTFPTGGAFTNRAVFIVVGT